MGCECYTYFLNSNAQHVKLKSQVSVCMGYTLIQRTMELAEIILCAFLQYETEGGRCQRELSRMSWNECERF